mgnify:CR=1 FL=1
MAKTEPSLDQWLAEAKADPKAAQCGMFLTHNGVVRVTPKKQVREGVEGLGDVAQVAFSYDAAVVDAAVEEALTFFENQPKLVPKLRTLMDVGLGYVRLGQSSPTLSGGEAQRVKLATELSRRDTGRTVYILDEPTTGLHMADVHKLVEVLQRLTDAGNTVIVIEHNLDVIQCADHIIDLGPEGGDGGGELVFAGTPEECAACPASFTGEFLKPALERYRK